MLQKVSCLLIFSSIASRWQKGQISLRWCEWAWPAYLPPMLSPPGSEWGYPVSSGVLTSFLWRNPCCSNFWSILLCLWLMVLSHAYSTLGTHLYLAFHWYCGSSEPRGPVPGLSLLPHISLHVILPFNMVTPGRPLDLNSQLLSIFPLKACGNF